MGQLALVRRSAVVLRPPFYPIRIIKVRKIPFLFAFLLRDPFQKRMAHFVSASQGRHAHNESPEQYIPHTQDPQPTISCIPFVSKSEWRL